MLRLKRKAVGVDFGETVPRFSHKKQRWKDEQCERWRGRGGGGGKGTLGREEWKRKTEGEKKGIAGEIFGQILLITKSAFWGRRRSQKHKWSEICIQAA